MHDKEPAIYSDVPRDGAPLLARLERLSVADLHQSLPANSGRAGLLDASLRPMHQGRLTCGIAVTAYCTPGDSLMSHAALYHARAGDVLILSNGGQPQGAIWGGNMALDAALARVAGVIVDGAIRDVAMVRGADVPTWYRHLSVAGVEKKGDGWVNKPVECAGRVVHPGDFIVADEDGVLVLPGAHARHAVEGAEAKMAFEAQVQSRMRQGARLFETQAFDALLEANGIRTVDGEWRAPDG